MFTNGRWDKWKRGANGYPSALKGYLPSALIFRCPFPPNVCKWAVGQMGTWKKWTFGGKKCPKCLKRVSQVPYAHTPKCSKMGTGANGLLGQMDIRGRSTPSILYPSPSFFKWAFGASCAHLPQCPFCPSVHLGKMSTI